LRIADGKVVKNEILPAISLPGFLNMIIAETRNYFIYGISSDKKGISWEDPYSCYPYRT